MITTALALVVFCAPKEAPILWAEEHGIGVAPSPYWRVVQKPAGDRIAVLSTAPIRGVPVRVEIAAMGASELPLDAFADRVRKALRARPGHKIVSRTRRRVGPFAAIRMGLTIAREGGKARGRLTLVRMGGQIVRLEASGAAAGFPNGPLDKLEETLRVRWRAVEHSSGVRVSVPAGWTLKKEEGPVVIVGPAVAGAQTLLFLEKVPDGEAEPPPPPEGAMKLGGFDFLGGKVQPFRVVRGVTKEQAAAGEVARAMGRFFRVPWSGGMVAAEAAWKESWPVARAIFERMVPAKPRPSKD